MIFINSSLYCAFYTLCINVYVFFASLALLYFSCCYFCCRFFIRYVCLFYVSSILLSIQWYSFQFLSLFFFPSLSVPFLPIDSLTREINEFIGLNNGESERERGRTIECVRTFFMCTFTFLVFGFIIFVCHSIDDDRFEILHAFLFLWIYFCECACI